MSGRRGWGSLGSVDRLELQVRHRRLIRGGAVSDHRARAGAGLPINMSREGPCLFWLWSATRLFVLA